jgi:DNA polymerase III subunit beta
MEVTVKKNDFITALSKTQFIVEKRSNLPVLSHVMLTAKKDSLTLSATDLEIGFEGVCPAEIGSEGAVTISAKKLYEIVKELSSEKIYLQERDNSWVFISGGDAKYNIFGLPAEDFPGLPQYESLTDVVISAAQFKRMIDCTLFSTSSEDTMYNTSGVYLEKIIDKDHNSLRMVSTDGHRLSLIDNDINGVELLNFDSGVVISKKGITEIKRLIEEEETLTIGISEKNCVVKTKNDLLVLRLLEKKFPDYRRAIPQEPKIHFNISRTLLLEMFRRMSILSTDRYRGVRLEIKPGSIDIYSTNPELGDAQEKKAVDYQGPEFAIGLNPTYIIDVLKVLESQEVNLNFSDPESGVIIQGEMDKGFLGMVMPMKLP